MVLRLGSKGLLVENLQHNLKTLGYSITVDGQYGYGTRNAVRRYQMDNKLFVDGIAGPITQASINANMNVKTIYRKQRYLNSDCFIAELSQDKYFVDFELGEMSVFEKLSRIVRGLLNNNKPIVLAINGGYFGGSNIEQMGTHLDEGSYRNVPDEKLITLLYRKTGRLEVKKLSKDYKLWFERNDYYWAIGATYSLVQDGKKNLQNLEYHSHGYSVAPRTLIGQKSDGTIIMVVVDGRTKQSKGLTASQSADLMLNLCCINAVNLDGGGSSEMIAVENNVIKVLNKPSDGTERKIGSSLVVYKK